MTVTGTPQQPLGTTPAAPALEVRELRREFGGIKALDGVTFTVAAGERRGIIGPNGAGKTTLFNVLTGELRPTGGSVSLQGRDVTGKRAWQLARRGLARMYQRNELFEPLETRENVALALGARRGPYRPFTGAPAGELEAAEALLDRVGLAGRERVQARSLSHGERRQLELAVALAVWPEVLLLDEPFASVDALTRAELEDLLLRIHGGIEHGRVTIVHVTHDIDEAVYLADRVLVLGAAPGRVIGSIEVGIARPRAQTTTRSSPQFLAVRNQIHDVITPKEAKR